MGAWNGLGLDITGFVPQLEIVFDRGSGYRKKLDHLCTGHPLVNRVQNTMPYILRVCSHARVLPHGSVFMKTAVEPLCGGGDLLKPLGSIASYLADRLFNLSNDI